MPFPNIPRNMLNRKISPPNIFQEQDLRATVKYSLDFAKLFENNLDFSVFVQVFWLWLDRVRRNFDVQNNSRINYTRMRAAFAKCARIEPVKCILPLFDSVHRFSRDAVFRNLNEAKANIVSNIGHPANVNPSMHLLTSQNLNHFASETHVRIHAKPFPPLCE